jgi:zinc transport system permease protein
MSDFLNALVRHAFMQYALLTGVLASVACGVIGAYVVVRHITYIAGGIAHCVLGGIGAALYFQRACGCEWLHPLYGAVAAALAAALIIGFVSLRWKQREDTVIGALWAIGMAVGVLFISQTPGYKADLMNYLFGNILMVTPEDLMLVGALDVVVVALGLLFYNKFLAVCFDEEFARVRGIRVEFYYLLLLCLTALTVVLLVTVVGIVMVIALLTLPVAVAGSFSRSLWQMMVLAAVFTVIFCTAGLAVGFALSLPVGATIIVIAGAAYLATMLVKQALRRHA